MYGVTISKMASHQGNQPKRREEDAAHPWQGREGPLRGMTVFCNGIPPTHRLCVSFVSITSGVTVRVWTTRNAHRQLLDLTSRRDVSRMAHLSPTS